MKKVKRRYLALAIDSSDRVNSHDFMDALWRRMLKLYGEQGASRVNLSLIDFDDEKKTAVVRTGHTCLDQLRAALASIVKVGNAPVAVHVLKVSGTLKALDRAISQ